MKPLGVSHRRQDHGRLLQQVVQRETCNSTTNRLTEGGGDLDLEHLPTRNTFIPQRRISCFNFALTRFWKSSRVPQLFVLRRASSCQQTNYNPTEAHRGPGESGPRCPQRGGLKGEGLEGWSRRALHAHSRLTHPARLKITWVHPVRNVCARRGTHIPDQSWWLQMAEEHTHTNKDTRAQTHTHTPPSL